MRQRNTLKTASAKKNIAEYDSVALAEVEDFVILACFRLRLVERTLDRNKRCIYSLYQFAVGFNQLQKTAI